MATLSFYFPPCQRRVIPRKFPHVSAFGVGSRWRRMDRWEISEGERIRPSYLQHMKQRRLSSIIETEKEQFRVLVEQPQRGEHVVD